MNAFYKVNPVIPKYPCFNDFFIFYVTYIYIYIYIAMTITKYNNILFFARVVVAIQEKYIKIGNDEFQQAE